MMPVRLVGLMVLALAQEGWSQRLRWTPNMTPNVVPPK